MDDPHPGKGFRLELGGEVFYLSKSELRGAAQIGRAHQILGAPQEEIEDAISSWLNERRESQRWFRRRG